MKKALLPLFLFVFIQACIPIRIAPKIDDYKITKGKRFKRKLPKRRMFVFKDEKNMEEFYKYVNTKFDLGDIDVYDDIPFIVDDQQYFFSWYEVEIPDKSFNLGAVAFDVLLNTALSNDEMESYVSDENTVLLRKENWYICIEVYSDLEEDCLSQSSLSKEVVLKYLRDLKKQYLATSNYNEVVFKN